jgi:serine phosphatase RsbU (regulator of sigma subunit)
MLADFVGHGLAAAIGGLPLSSIFHATARKQVPLPEVLVTMNDALRGFLPAGYFCGALLLDLDAERGCVQFWNGAMPPSVMWSPRRSQFSLMESSHLPLGVVSSAELGSELTTLPLEPGDHVLIMSDGVTEFQGPSGDLFGLPRLERALRDAPERDPFDSVMDAITSFSDLLTQTNDDVSLIRLSVPERAERGA